MEKDTNTLSTPIVKPRKGIPAVWLVPVIAVVFGAWLIIKTVAERGVFIDIRFDNANGIVAGKTEIRYKGLTLGVVKTINTTDDLQGVVIEAEIIKEAKDTLTENTKFWYVTADVSLSGIKGIDTLLSGSYINMLPDIDADGQPQREFVALKEEPMLDQLVPGLHLTLTADSLGSLVKDSPVSYKEINVGHVSGYDYDKQGNNVDIYVLIEPEYADLVKGNTRFYNASGLTVTGSLTTGINVHAESFASLISGGIAFDTLDYQASKPSAENGDKFQLHANFQDAELGKTISLDLDWDSSIDVGTPIVYQGITLGRLDSFTKIDPATKKIQALAKINPRVDQYLNTETQFYLINPTFDLGGVTNLNRIISGTQIGVSPALGGEPTTQFRLYHDKPPLKYSEPGLHIQLTSSHANSIAVGTEIYYQQQLVGKVEAIENTDVNNNLLYVFIEPEFQQFVREDSRFWDASGINISGGLQDFSVQTHSMQALLKGAIAFDKGSSTKEVASNGQKFSLFQNKNTAQQRLSFEILLPSAKGVKVGTRILYRGEVAGAIHQIKHIDGQVKLTAGLFPEFDFMLKQGSQFWLVEASLSLAGLNDTDALFGGNYFSVNVGSGAATDQFVGYLSAPKKPLNAEGLQIAINASAGGSLAPSSPISYRGITVGQIDNVALAQDGKQVLINATIDEKHRHLIGNDTRFYQAGGVTVIGGLGNFSVKTESASTMLTGGISFYNSSSFEQEQEQEIEEGTSFKLYENLLQAQNAGLAIKVEFDDVGSLHAAMPVKYQQQQVGMVERLVYREDGYGVTAIILLNEQGKKFAVAGSKFWLATPELGLVGSQNLGAILDGGVVAVLPGNGEQLTTFHAEQVPPAVSRLPFGLNLTLIADTLGSVRVGNPVLYRQVKVGTVIGVDLAATADKVNIFINIADRYRNLVSPDSQFWNSSGFSVDAGIFSGVQIDSESIETLLSGGIAFATPEESDAGKANQGQQFILNSTVDESWQQWQPKIAIGQ
ncbi:MlaD family protein [Colwellia sp. MEBiC06753]